MKKVLLLAVVVAFLSSCQSTKKQVYSVDELSSKASELVDQTVTVKGRAMHICHTSGRRLFLGSETSDNMLNVVANPEMPIFDTLTTGKNYTVTGVVKVSMTIDEKYLDEWQKEVEEQGVKEGTHICATEQKAMGIDTDSVVENPQMKQITTYREKIAANGGQPLVFYHVQCKEFTIDK